MTTQSELKEALNYNPETGVFTWIISRGNGVKSGDVAGYIMLNGYASIRIGKISYLSHRLAFLYVYGRWPKEIDHINHDKSDNRWVNLREVSKQENQRNRSMNKNNTSGVAGVGWDKKNNRWEAQIKAKGKSIKLGRFIDKFEAICARKSANNKYGFHENHGRKI